MQKKRVINCILKLIFAVATILATGFLVAAVVTALSKNSNYFDRTSPLPILATIFTTVALLCGSVAAFLTKRAELSPSPFPTKAGKSIALAAPAAVGYAASLLFFFPAPSQGRLPFFLFALSLLSLAYAVASALPGFRQNHAACAALLGFSPVLLCVLYNAYYYFDVSVEMNAPIKTLLQAGLLAAMLTFTGEIRFYLNRERPAFFLMLSVWTVAIGAPVAPSVILAYVLQKNDRPDYLIGGILLLALTVSAIGKLCVMLFPKDDSLSTVCDASEEDTVGKEST